ncbi:MAG: beta-N-acetylhexosaminidase [Terracidiphilus sp.]
MKESIRQAAGSLLVVGLGDKELTTLERAWLKLVRPAGIILFKRNIADTAQTRALLTEATAFCPPHSGAFVDVEGGTVDRLRDVLAPLPPVETVANAARQPGKAVLARQHGELIARAVKAFGFNSSLAPVLDLALPESRSVMTTRCAAATGAGVVAYACEFFAGLKSQGVAGCGKHFPGLGGGTLDSHLETPKIQRGWDELWKEDMEPYRALRRQMPMVMVNHAAYPLTADPERPATVSKFWMQTVLRKRIGYRGIVVSDDLEMGGVAKFMPIADAAADTVRLGADLALICHHPEPIFEAYEALIREGERSATFHRILMERAKESARKRLKTFPAKIPSALTQKQFDALRARILRFGETVTKAAGQRNA